MPPVPEPGHVGEGGDAERPALVPVGGDERAEEVHLVLVSHPGVVQILEGIEEPGGGELRRPDRVEDREVRRLPFRDGMGQRLVQRRSRDGDDVDLDRSVGAVPDHPRPGAFLGHHHANLGLVGPPVEPMRVDERPTAPVPENDALLGELRQRAAHRCPADLVAVAELVLGGELSVPPVDAAEDLLQKHRLQLEVEGNRLVRIDRHQLSDRIRETDSTRGSESRSP